MIKAYLQTLKLFSFDARLYLVANTITSISYVGIYVMLFNLYLLRLGYGPEFIGLINAAAQLGVVVFSLPAGLLGRRWNIRRVLVVGLSVGTVGLGLVPLAEFVPSEWQATWLVVIYVFAWLGGTTYMVNSLPFVMSVTGAAERTHVFSVREALAPVSLFAGNLIGGLLPGFLSLSLGSTLADPAPYRYTLFAAAALFGLAPLTLLATSEVKGNDTAPLPGAAKPPARTPAPIGLMAFLAVVMLLQLAGKSMTDTFLNVYLDVSLHLTPAWIGTLSAVAQLLVIPLALAAPLIMKQWGKGWTIIGGAVGMGFSLLLLALIPHWGGAALGLTSVNALFALTNLAFTLSSQELVSPEWRATMSGAMAMAMGVSRSTLAFGGGYLISLSGFSSLFWVGAGLTLAGALLFWGYTWLPRHYLLYRAGLKAVS
ncbi:MAG TPA: MFS transporter [Anaerolineae bacterium]|nr:MFS transporter [Anaerolineae bacterium]